jgi:hypothetical protein
MNVFVKRNTYKFIGSVNLRYLYEVMTPTSACVLASPWYGVPVFHAAETTFFHPLNFGKFGGRGRQGKMPPVIAHVLARSRAAFPRNCYKRLHYCLVI